MQASGEEGALIFKQEVAGMGWHNRSLAAGRGLYLFKANRKTVSKVGPGFKEGNMEHTEELFNTQFLRQHVNTSNENVFQEHVSKFCAPQNKHPSPSVAPHPLQP